MSRDALMAATAGEVLARYEPPPAVKAGIDASQRPDTAVRALRGADAVRFWAQAMRPRHAVCWALRCLDEAPGGGPEPGMRPVAALRAWVADPSDANRRACHSAAEAAGLEHPASLIAASVFFSGGSLAPPDLPEVAPKPNLRGDLLASALELAAVRVHPERAADTFARFVALGLETAEQPEPWKHRG
jgi:hypothetical protein